MVTMGTRTRVGFVALALGACTAALLLLLRARLDRPTPADPPDAAARDAPQRVGLRGSPPKPARIDPRRALTVRVEDPGGHPVPGAGVEVRPAREGGGAIAPPTAIFVSGSTDGAGRVTLDLPDEALVQEREIRVERSGFVGEVRRTSDLDVLVRLGVGAALRGRVFDAETGSGLVGIPVLVGRAWGAATDVEQRTVSGENGAFAFSSLRPGLSMVSVRSPEWADFEAGAFALEPERAKTLEIPLRRGAQIAGVVTDGATGHPVERGRVEFLLRRISGVLPKTANLAEGGEFVLRGLPAAILAITEGRSVLDLRLVAEGYDVALTQKVGPAFDMTGRQTRKARFEAKPDVRAEGRVLDEGGQAIPGARVALGGAGMLLAELARADAQAPGSVVGRSRIRQTVTDATGAFGMGVSDLLHLAAPPAKGLRLLVVHPGFRVLYRAVSTEELATPIEVRLGAGVHLDVEVVDPQGRPEAGARIRRILLDASSAARPSEGVDPFAFFSGPTLCDANGRAVLSDLCAGAWELRVRSADERRSAKHGVVLGSEASSLRIALTDAPLLAGTVVDDASDEPVAGAVVGMHGGVDGLPRSAISDSDGRFEFRCAEGNPRSGGLVLVVLEVPGRGLWTSPPLEGVQPGVPVVLRARCRVKETREVTGSVVDAVTGAPVPSGLVKCRWHDPREPQDQQGGLDTRFYDGAFTRSVPVADAFRLSFQAEGYEPLTLSPEESARSDIAVRLSPTPPRARVRVRVQGGESSDPMMRGVPTTVWVQVYDAVTKRERGQSTPRILPEFLLTEAEMGGAGSSLLELQVPGWCQPTPVECRLEPGRETEVTVVLVRGGATLRGTVDAEPESLVTLTYPAGLVRRLHVDDSGRFAADGLPPGTYVLALAGGAPLRISLADGPNPDVRLSK